MLTAANPIARATIMQAILRQVSPGTVAENIFAFAFVDLAPMIERSGAAPEEILQQPGRPEAFSTP
jgi:hypothetical protein